MQEDFRLALFKTNKEGLFAEQVRSTKRSVNFICSFFGSRQEESCEI